MPKTLIFAKDDAHAEEIVEIAREVFGKGNDFVAKITYKATGRKTDDLIAAFRNSPNPRIAVTVDMIATGTDVKPLECVFFMRAVKSRTYFEQMKGRGVRVISDTDLQAVVPGATSKERFVIVDAVGVTESELSETPPLDRQPTVPLEQLLRQVSFGVRDPDAISAIASRLARLDRRLTDTQRTQLAVLAGGKTLKEIAGGIVAALDPDRQLEAAREATGSTSRPSTRSPPPSKALLDEAVAPLAHSPELRERIVEARRSLEQAIDETSADDVLEAGYSKEATDRARDTVESWERFCEEHHDEIAALQILYSKPYAAAADLRRGEGARRCDRAPAAPLHARAAVGGLRGARPLARARLGPARADRPRLARARRAAPGGGARAVPRARPRALPRLAALAGERGARVHAEQLAWLEDIRDHVAASLGISADDFDYTPFLRGGRARQGGAGLRRRPRPAARRAQRGARHVSELPPGWAIGRSLSCSVRWCLDDGVWVESKDQIPQASAADPSRRTSVRASSEIDRAGSPPSTASD